MKTSNVVLIIIGTLTIIFTIVMIVLFWTHYSVPDTLITCWFGAVAGECGFLGWIKTSKVKYLAFGMELSFSPKLIFHILT